MSDLRAPFPWFGGKSRAAELIWSRLGDCANFVEPFAGSLAVLLGRPTEARIETVNDLDAMVANFWRSIAAAPDEVAHHADWPVNEPDLHARHRWLVANLPAHRERMLQEADYFDAKIAGWWVWGLSQWIGSGWCDGRLENKRPTLGPGRGAGEIPGVHGASVHLPQKRPKLGAAGQGQSTGVHRLGAQVPRCNGLGGQGVHGARVPGRQLPAISLPNGGYGLTGVHSQHARTEGLYAWFAALQQRLRRVRVCCGDWTRIMGPSVILGNGVTGIVLDPPYSHDVRYRGLYAEDKAEVSADVRRWAIEHGDDKRLRIALCGYEGEHEMPATWECVAWKANGGYANVSGEANRNKHLERVWFSPACLRAAGPAQIGLAL